jgi:hypothetical protein
LREQITHSTRALVLVMGDMVAFERVEVKGRRERRETRSGMSTDAEATTAVKRE